MAVNRGQRIEAGHLTALATLANSKSQLAGDYGFGSNDWLTEFNRIWGDVFDLYSGNGLIDYNNTLVTRDFVSRQEPPPFSRQGVGAVAGPHVLAYGTSVGVIYEAATNSLTRPISNLMFYFPGTSATLTSTAKVHGNYADQLFGNVLDNLSIMEYQGPNPVYSTQTWKAKIRIVAQGSGTLRIKPIRWGVRRKAASSSTDHQMTITTTLPGATYTVFPSPNWSIGDGYAQFEVPAGTTCAPGVYTVDVSCGPDFYFVSYFVPGTVGGTAINDENYITFAVTSTAATPVAAIHGTSPVSKIECVQVVDTNEERWPFGIFGQSSRAQVANTNLDCITGQVFTDTVGYDPPSLKFRFYQSSTFWTGSVTGLFVGKTMPMVRNHCEQDQALPWTRKVSLAFDSTMRGPAPTASTATLKQTPSALNYGISRWPVLGPGGYLKPGAVEWGTVPGYCIYQIWARRRVKQTAGQPFYLEPRTTGEIVIQVGHWRSGVFVALDTLTIAAGAMESPRKTVFWPVFTQTMLAYESTANEHVHLYAMANHQPPYFAGFNPWENGIGFPISSDQYNDLEKMLQKMP